MGQVVVTNDPLPPSGTLYVVSTPIGNLEDITLRALRVLREVDTIAAENVDHTKWLCGHYGIRTPISSYHQHNQRAKADHLLNLLKSGMSIALVTDAGTPGISDPGAWLIHKAVKEGLRVVPVPGPSAILAALSVSGLPTDRFLFVGFLSNRGGKRRKELKKLVNQPCTMVFYEAPHRIHEMLADLRDIFGKRPIVLARELTKAFEEVLRGSAEDLLASLTPENRRGEFTLVVAGAPGKETGMEWSEDVLNRVEQLIRAGDMSVKDIGLLVSRETGIPYRQIYQACLHKKDEMEQQNQTQFVKRLRVSNSLGLHARSAAKIVDLGRQHRSRLFLRKDGEEVDGSSILSILTLACPKGTEIEARIVGEDSELFMERLTDLFEKNFGEKG